MGAFEGGPLTKGTRKSRLQSKLLKNKVIIHHNTAAAHLNIAVHTHSGHKGHATPDMH